MPRGSSTHSRMVESRSICSQFKCRLKCTGRVQRMSADEARSKYQTPVLGDPLLVSRMIVGKCAEIQLENHGFGLAGLELDFGKTLSSLVGELTSIVYRAHTPEPLPCPPPCRYSSHPQNAHTIHILKVSAEALGFVYTKLV